MSGLRALSSSRWFRAALSAALLAVLFFETDRAMLWQAIRTVHGGWLLLALCGYVASQVLSAFRWYLLARPLGFAEPFAFFFTCHFSGMFLNLFAPGTVAGDIGRALFLADRQRRSLALTSVAAHRGLGFVALMWMAAAAIVCSPAYPVPSAVRLVAGLAVPATIIAWLYGPSLVMRWLPGAHRMRRLAEHNLAPYWKDHRLLAASLVLAGLFHAVQIGTQIVIASAVGLISPWSFFFVFVPIVNIAGMLPISLSGVGIREAGYWYFLSLVGAQRETAVAFGLLASAVVLASGLIGAPAFLALQLRNRRPDRPRNNGTSQE